jgi:c-di-GMP-related signal transduction protein
MTGAEVVVARQPIFDLGEQIVAYELLYRPGDGAGTDDGEQMTVEVVLGALSFGVDQIVGDKVVFCNADRGVLTGATPVMLPPARTVIEVLETVVLDDEVVAGCQALVREGYRLALDDFVWVDGAERLLPLADVVKVDMRLTPRAEVTTLLERCRGYDVRFLAEKVETAEEVEWCRAHGFEFFQGYALQRPQVLRQREISGSEIGRLQLATAMLTQEFDFAEIEQILRGEPGLVLQLLHLAAEGSAHGLRRQVRSVREALVLVGAARLRRWIALLTLQERAPASPDGLAAALMRARMCEALAQRQGLASPDFAFAAGLVSSFDLLLGVPLEQITSSLDIDPELRSAALGGPDEIGLVVADVIGYQHDLFRGRPDVEANALDEAASIAFTWAMSHLNSVDASNRSPKH